MKSENESADTKSTRDKKKICEACQKRETGEKDEYKEQKDDEFKIKMTKRTELNK